MWPSPACPQKRTPDPTVRMSLGAEGSYWTRDADHMQNWRAPAALQQSASLLHSSKRCEHCELSLEAAGHVVGAGVDTAGATVASVPDAVSGFSPPGCAAAAAVGSCGTAAVGSCDTAAVSVDSGAALDAGAVVRRTAASASGWSVVKVGACVATPSAGDAVAWLSCMPAAGC